MDENSTIELGKVMAAIGGLDFESVIKEAGASSSGFQAVEGLLLDDAIKAEIRKALEGAFASKNEIDDGTRMFLEDEVLPNITELANLLTASFPIRSMRFTWIVEDVENALSAMRNCPVISEGLIKEIEWLIKISRIYFSPDSTNSGTADSRPLIHSIAESILARVENLKKQFRLSPKEPA